MVQIEAGVVEVLASTGDNHLGGDDFDEVLTGRLNDHLETEAGIEHPRDDRLLQARLRRAAERAKIELSVKPYTRVEEDHVAHVDGDARHLSCELSREDFERDIEDLLGRTMKAVSTALADANVRPSQLDRVLLVGGSTRIPRVAELLAERLAQEPHGEVDPDLCVAYGAAIQAGMEMGQDTQAVLVDVTPYTFGTGAYGDLYGRPYAHQFIPLIRRNTKLPATRTEAFFTLYEDQESVRVKVYQGEDPDALKNLEIGAFNFDGLNRTGDAYDRGLLFTYRLDLDGILQVHAVERATGREIRGVVEGALARTSAESLAASRRRVGALWGEEDAGAAPQADRQDLVENTVAQAIPDETQERSNAPRACSRTPRRRTAKRYRTCWLACGKRWRMGARARKPTRSGRNSMNCFSTWIDPGGKLPHLRRRAPRRTFLPPLPDRSQASAGDRASRGPSRPASAQGVAQRPDRGRPGLRPTCLCPPLVPRVAGGAGHGRAPRRGIRYGAAALEGDAELTASGNHHALSPTLGRPRGDSVGQAERFRSFHPGRPGR